MSIDKHKFQIVGGYIATCFGSFIKESNVQRIYVDAAFRICADSGDHIYYLTESFDTEHEAKQYLSDYMWLLLSQKFNQELKDRK